MLFGVVFQLYFTYKNQTPELLVKEENWVLSLLPCQLYLISGMPFFPVKVLISQIISIMGLMKIPGKPTVKNKRGYEWDLKFYQLLQLQVK